MFRDTLDQIEKEIADCKLEEDKELKENPLIQFSTSQLKAEIRRRKKQSK
jgi:hypothetical protein